MFDGAGIPGVNIPYDEGIIIKQGSYKTLIGMNDRCDSIDL